MSVREIVFDTETTGFNPEEGHRLVEIGAVELINHIPTGRHYHQYINPDRDVPDEAFKVHGLSADFLKDFPRFREIAYEFIEFIGDDILVAHNAVFDMNFVNYELKHIGKEIIAADRFVDTLEIAKKLHPGARNNLDALCKRYNIDNSKRTSHGALLDSELLAQVYLELLGGQEPSMILDTASQEQEVSQVLKVVDRKFREARSFGVSDEELRAHEKFLQSKLKNAVWLSEII
jgi:DNA polymerase-3 subunit epsilon